MRRARRLGPLVVLGAFIAGMIVVAACGSSDDASGPPPLATTTSRNDAGAPNTAPTAPRDAGAIETSAGATTYKGTLDTTPPVKFGGAPYCDYTITLKQVEIEVAALESGEVIGAAVKDVAVEGATPPCPYSPTEPVAQSFALTTATKTSGGLTLAFEGAKTNRTETALVIDLAHVGITYEASAGWTRTDAPAPLDWSVKAKLTLQPK